MIEMNLIEFGIFFFLAFCGAFCLVYGLIIKIKEKKFTKLLKHFQTGGVILLDGGYQPTEKNETALPPNSGSNVQPPKSVTNIQQHITFDENHVEKWCLENAGIKVNSNKVFISPETAKKIIEKKNIPRLEKNIPQLVVAKVEGISLADKNPKHRVFYHCPFCDSYNRKNRKRCIRCSQALDWEGVSENG